MLLPSDVSMSLDTINIATIIINEFCGIFSFSLVRCTLNGSVLLENDYSYLFLIYVYKNHFASKTFKS